jgi:RimJ/RimL family protein N-acetyltransferase
MIVGDRVRLRAVERGDIPAFLRWFNDPEVRGYLSMVWPISAAQEERWFEGHLGDDSNRVFAIETSEGIHIGNIGLHGLDWKNRSARTGIVVGEKGYWNQGYGSDALRVLLRFACEELNLHRVSLRVFDFNRRGVRCYEKVGFRHEARLRRNHFTQGRYVDELVMGILQEEWRAQEDAA